MRKNISLVIQGSTFDVGLDQYSNGNGSSGATVGTAASAATTATRTPRKNIERDQNPAGLDSNLVTLIDFKKTLLEEQKKGEERIQELNTNIESAKKQIDDERVQLEELRVKLKHTNEQKDTELTRYTEVKNTLIEARNRMKSMDDFSAAVKPLLSSIDFIRLRASMRVFLTSVYRVNSVSFCSFVCFSLTRNSSSWTLSSSICFLADSMLVFSSWIRSSPFFCSSNKVFLKSISVTRFESNPAGF